MCSGLCLASHVCVVSHSLCVCECQCVRMRVYMHSHERVGSHRWLAHPPAPLPCTFTFMSADVPCGQRLNTSHPAAPRVRETRRHSVGRAVDISGSGSASGVSVFVCASRPVFEQTPRVAFQLLTGPPSPAFRCSRCDPRSAFRDS